MINGTRQGFRSLTQEQVAQLVQDLQALDGFDHDFIESPAMGSIVDSSTQHCWLGHVFVDSDSKPVFLFLNPDREGSLSLALAGPVLIKTMLDSYVWLRWILDAICQLANEQMQDPSVPSADRFDRLRDWFAILEEVASHMTATQANVVSRMTSQFKDVVLNPNRRENMTTLRVLNQLVDDTNADIEREIFWK